MLIKEIAFRSVRPGSPYEKRVVPPAEIKPPKERKPRVKMSPEEKARRVASAAAERRERQKRLLWQVYNIVVDAVGNAIPDGDPIDQIIPRMNRLLGFNTNNRSDRNMFSFGEKMRELLDKACRKYGRAKSYDDYLAQMWDMYDDMNSESDGLDLYSLTNKPEELPGYDNKAEILRKAKVQTKRPNPWR